MVEMVEMVEGCFLPKKKSKKNKISLEYREENLEVSTARISGVTIDCFRLLASSPVPKMMGNTHLHVGCGHSSGHGWA